MPLGEVKPETYGFRIEDETFHTGGLRLCDDDLPDGEWLSLQVGEHTDRRNSRRYTTIKVLGPMTTHQNPGYHWYPGLARPGQETVDINLTLSPPISRNHALEMSCEMARLGLENLRNR